ncbi:conserved hypothetical protein [Anaeromyxobacter dehalogenans 2CP-1]|uniref:Uncharacterized protein n=1 Tax=Anaeromyxobacter dehalogenans (strain ATCC BAA-258 / DSM 21875 / 2CP-1) TaxID=455488 RepID=B8J8R5_ANAD2|nr:hypothetical protein [Anaeromyxobacter dehalogenans]ACL63513.1 conserved hypothetical protein [Anaeromyxobacter dehalogenans 2CP-1]
MATAPHDDPEPTARPTDRLPRELLEEEDEKLVPASNVGGAAPTALGADSGGDLPGSEDDLANMSEPEPPEPPEVGAVHVRRGAAGEEEGEGGEAGDDEEAGPGAPRTRH